MPEYQMLRKKHSLLELFRTSELIQEVTLLPLKAFDLDAAIIFSDILIACDGLGIDWEVLDGVGPVIKTPFSIEEKRTLRSPEEAYGPLLKAIRSLKKELKVPLLGFSAAPLTLAAYLIEGRSPKEMKRCKELLYSDPERFKKLLEELAEALGELLIAQIEAGVDAVQIFDTYAMEIGVEAYERWVLPTVERLLAKVSGKCPTLLFSRGSAAASDLLAPLKPTALSLDWSIDMKKMRQKYPGIALQGNLDPALLFGSKKIIKASVEALLEKMKGDRGFIFNLGHGILPGTPYENVGYLVECVKGSFR